MSTSGVISSTSGASAREERLERRARRQAALERSRGSDRRRAGRRATRRPSTRRAARSTRGARSRARAAGAASSRSADRGSADSRGRGAAAARARTTRRRAGPALREPHVREARRDPLDHLPAAHRLLAIGGEHDRRGRAPPAPDRRLEQPQIRVVPRDEQNLHCVTPRGMQILARRRAPCAPGRRPARRLARAIRPCIWRRTRSASSR